MSKDDGTNHTGVQNPTINSPVRPYRTIVQDSGDPGYVNRVLIGTAVTGLVRIEWVQARYGQIIPCNWSHVAMLSAMNSYMPVRYQVADAQNLIVKHALEADYEWILLWEHDVCPAPDFLQRLDYYMSEARTPIVSGLYYTRSRPSDPLVYRGRGTGAYRDWKQGDKIFCDGVPTGLLLIHRAVLKTMWDESPEYAIRNVTTRRVFETPRNAWYDPQSGQYNSMSGTSDLFWCERVLKEDVLRRSGWGDYVDSLEDPRFPFLLDTALSAIHINPNGEQFP